jgi:hypothetical protein
MMIRLLAPVAPLLVGVAILLIGQGLQGTLLPLRANLEGFSTLTIGLMGGAYFFGFTLGCLRGSNLVRRVGHVRVFAAMTAAASAAADVAVCDRLGAGLHRRHPGDAGRHRHANRFARLRGGTVRSDARIPAAFSAMHARPYPTSFHFSAEQGDQDETTYSR